MTSTPEIEHERATKWHCRDRVLDLRTRAHVMGILNVTPDSFSDGGQYCGLSQAIDRGMDMVAAGVDIIDVGGESTRPGAKRVSVSEELRRVIPVIEGLAEKTDCLISIDTSKAAVATAAIDAGAYIVNDVSAVRADPKMLPVVAKYGVGVVLMHMQGDPRTMQQEPYYTDVLGEVCCFLRDRAETCRAGGVQESCIAIDPGIGFGKTLEHNLALLRGMPELVHIGYPVLTGLSRKSLLGAVLNRKLDERLAGSLAGAAFAVMRGSQLLRVHDVQETVDTVRFLAALLADS